MSKRLLSMVAIWTFVVGCFVVFGETRVPAAQDRTTHTVPAVPRAAPATPRIKTESPVEQMRAFEHHARYNMILYSGRFGQFELASVKGQLDALALSVKAGK